MSEDLTLTTVQSQLTKQQQLLINEETVEEINKLAKDPEYGPEFLQSYLEHLNVLADAPKNNHTQYLNAIKFFSLVEAGNSLTDAYIKVFPERFQARQRHYTDPEDAKKNMRGEASRYNMSKLVNDIRKVAAIPVHLIHRHLLHEAILETANLMTNARSEMVRAKAADTLIRELKPTEDATLNVKVEDGSASAIEELRKASQELAAAQREAVQAGLPVKQIAAARIFSNDEDDIIDVQPESASDD